MYRKISALIAFFALANSSFALTEAGKEALKKMTDAMRAEVEVAAKEEAAGDKSRHPGASTLRSSISQIEAAAAAEIPEQRQFFRSSFTTPAGFFTSPEVAEAVAVFKREIAAEEKAALDEQAAKIEALLKRAGEQVASAKEPAELDEVIVELGQLGTVGYDSNGQLRLGRLNQDVESTKQFVTQWQDYLSAMKTGNKSAAVQTLRNITGYGNRANLIPRSKLLEIIAELSAEKEKPAKSAKPENDTRVLDTISEIKTLADVSAAIKTLSDLQSEQSRGQSSSYQDISSLIQSLSEISRSHRDYQSGLPVALELGAYSGQFKEPEITAKLAFLRSEMLKLALPRYVDAPAGSVAKEGETPLEFLDRLAQEAKDRQDPATGYRIRKARNTLMRGNSFATQDTAGLNSYVSAQNQETAGQFELAVDSYQQALKSGSDLVPAKLIGERLDAIKAAHPRRFRKGWIGFLRRRRRAILGRCFARHFRRGRMGRPVKANPSLLIPAPKDSEKENPAPAPKVEKE